ncbi:MAG: sigma-54 dependent transcriptional regulator [Myxococcales bacterium]|nr:sigma-54 dependent transcriptional regulator [Myxococcales bacterium]
MRKLLLCDDEDSLCRGLARLLRTLSFDVVTADGPQGLGHVANGTFDVIVTDLRMPEVNGFEILEAARRHSPSTPVIVMSGSAEIPDAVRAMRAGARDFLIKPFEFPALEEVLDHVLGFSEKTPPPILDPSAWRDRFAPWLLGEDPAIMPVLAMIAQVADTSCTVLITGESGTGKELVARSIVAGSPRAKTPFVAVNCAAIPETLVESELFGHTKGAFTGANNARTGRFGQADGGTIFLDEVGEMEMGVQAKLLRVIQEGELYPVGQEAPVQIDVRVIAATNRDLAAEAEAGRFRSDLYWRLNVIPIEMPPLRSRPADIPLLVEHFMKRANQHHRRAILGLEPPALDLLKRHSWPGNIRELENLIERLVIMKGSGRIGVSDLPSNIRLLQTSAAPAQSSQSSGVIPSLPEEAGATDLKTILEAVEERMIAEALERTGGNKNKAAELLGLNRTTLVEKLRRKRLTPHTV